MNDASKRRFSGGRRGSLLLVLCILLVAPFWSAPAAAQSYEEVSRLISQWQLGEAERKLESMGSGSAGAQFLQARLDFLHGRYARAGSRLDQLFENVEARGEWKKFRKLVRVTRKTTEGYDKYTSDDGTFEIYVPSGKDRVLVPYALNALRRAYDALGEELGHEPDPPIRVEVYPRTSTLAKVSGLTDEEIRTSGTIALCKYNRLMITSPKALLRGYGWVDTLIHEYVHYVINSATTARVPIWMHEGLAKYLEHRWRGPDAARLPPSSEYLLKQRVEANDLVTFEQMHPSMAKLPSQEDAATAFAEVYTAMEYLRREAGAGAFRDLLSRVSEVGDARRAFADVLETNFSTFKRRWRTYLRGRKTPNFPEGYGYENHLVFKDETNKKEASEEEPDRPEAKDHLKLGEMLQAQSRYGAAVVQYRKAVRLSDTPTPRLRTRLAASLTRTGRPGEALKTLGPVERLYPTKVGVWLESGKAHLKNDQPKKALADLREAVRINPFDPEIHELMASAHETLGRTATAERERKFATMVK